MANVPGPGGVSVAPKGGDLGVSAPREAFGSSGAALSRLGSTVSHISDAFAQRAEQMQAITNKIDADSAAMAVAEKQGNYIREYQSANQGERAAPNMTQAYKDIAAIREEGGATLRNPNAQLMFNQQTRIGTLQATQGLSSWAAREDLDSKNRKIDAVTGLALQSATDANYDAVRGTVATQAALKAGLNGWAPEVGQAWMADKLGDAAYNVTIQSAQTDPTAARTFYNAHKDTMSPGQRAQAESSLHASETNILVKDVANRYTEAAAASATSAAVGAATNTSYRGAIASIESGGNYTAQGPTTRSGDRAYGKYQVMGANIPRWTKEVLGRSMTPKEFLANPAAQDKVFDAKFGQSVAKYGNAEDAASVWFTGKPRAEGATRRDVNGTTGAQYVSRFSAALGGVDTGQVREDRFDAMERNAPEQFAAIANEPTLRGDPNLIEKVQRQFLANISQERALNNMSIHAAQERLGNAALQSNLQDTAQLQAAYPGALEDYNSLSFAGKRAVESVLRVQGNEVTPEREANERALMGRLMDPTTSTAAAHESLQGADLTLAQRNRMFAMQQKVLKKDAAHAQKQLALQSALANPYVKMQTKVMTPAEKDVFTGAFNAELDQWNATHPGKRPTPMEVGEIANGLAAKKLVPGYLLSLGPIHIGPKMVDGGKGFEVPQSEVDIITEKFTAARGHAPTPAQIAYIYHGTR